jgi:hypothetical protein
MKISEDRLQQLCFMHFTNTYCLKHHEPRLLMFSVPNDSASVTEQMRKKATGLIAGVSDTIIVFPNKVVFCEFKTPTGKQSDSQIDFEARINKLGFEYWIIRDLETFKKFVKNVCDLHC